MVAYLYMHRLRDPRMCSQTKFGIPRIYARDTIFLDLMAVVKLYALHDPKCIKTRILAFLAKII